MEEKNTEVKVGPYPFTIYLNQLNSDDDNIGQCFSYQQKIELREHLAKDILGSTICHELLHAMLFSAGVEFSKEQEDIICNALDSPLYALLKDNKEFIIALSNGTIENFFKGDL